MISGRDAHRAGVVHRLHREFGKLVSQEVIEQTLDESYERWNAARITMYVPVLAERSARERLRSLVGARTA